MKSGSPYGIHRVVEPEGALPQSAEKIDNRMGIFSNEILIDVETLNIDSASFTQIKESCSGDLDKIAETIKDIVEKRGKMQNPVTGSGGMLVGRVVEIGPDLSNRPINVGVRIATLVSLSLTPLRIDEIININPETDQVDIKGKAVLFESGIYTKLPEDISRKLALAVLDVAGAPAQVKKLVKPGMNVCIIGGGGKSGILCAYQASKIVGNTGKVIIVENSMKNAKRIEKLDIATDIVIANAKKPVDVLDGVIEITDGKLCDVVINNVNVEATEMSSILITKDEGTVYFFSMATDFTRAALGAEGVGKDITMIIGNGYTKNHAKISLNIIRESSKIRELFEQLYI
ncbi:MAG: L-erythro-3,5-diaminohexanoate dehydrogenase [Kosmotogaceae bacterium]